MNDPSLRVISDHLRASAFLVADGVTPSNEGRGYVLRRIIRRALRHVSKLGSKQPVLSLLIPTLIKEMSDTYPILKKNSKLIESNILQEEELFSSTLIQGLDLLKEEIKNLKEKIIPGELVFKLYDTYGFPSDMTADYARENNLKVDLEGYHSLMAKQKERGRDANTFISTFSESLNLTGTTDFVGYDVMESKAKIIDLILIKSGKSQEKIKKSQEALIILNKTPFYAEAGGQVGDKGDIISGKFKFEVLDVKLDKRKTKNLDKLVANEVTKITNI